MFERYSEKARRIVFFSRYEASVLGSKTIGTEHMLLGLLREDEELASRILSRPAEEIEDVRRQIEERFTAASGWISTSVELPLSPECQRALVYAMEEADRRHETVVESPHMLLGLIRDDQSKAAEIIRGMGVTLEEVRKKLGE